MNRKLDVFLREHLLGELEQNSDGLVSFHYNKEWIHSLNAYAISCTLPLQEKVFKQKECRAFFAGLLPEENNREIIAKILGISPRNDFSMLEKIGGECAGALTFLEQGNRPDQRHYRYHYLDEEQLYDLIKALDTRPLLVGNQDLRLSLAGAQNKMGLYQNKDIEIALPLSLAPSTHILKPAIERFPNIVSNEALCLELAGLVGIPTAKANMRQLQDIEYLIVERYDRIQSTKKFPLRLHQEDFCQALAVVPEKKYQSDQGPSLQACFDLVRNFSSLPAIDLKNLLKLVFFNVIIGNHDAHAKNFSFLYDDRLETLKISLAPAYDLLSTVYYPVLTENMAMKLGGEYRSEFLKLSHFEKFASDIGFNFKAMKKEFLELTDLIQENLNQIQDKYLKVPDLVQLIRQRSKRLLKIFIK